MIGACRCATSWCDFDGMCDFGFAKMFFAAIYETYFYHKDIDCNNRLLSVPCLCMGELLAPLAPPAPPAPPAPHFVFLITL